MSDMAVEDRDIELQDRVLFALSECRDALLAIWRPSTQERHSEARKLRVERALNRAKSALSEAQQAGWELPSLDESSDAVTVARHYARVLSRRVEREAS
ncbi:MAG TPA: hypothetical protein VLJ17_15105 [Xanthobacteraceae bacterium]|nr:hypothetical protein [Xanthobacteraceae bacterium]